MKKKLIVLLLALFLTACSNNTGEKIATLHLLKYQLSSKLPSLLKKIVVIRTQHQLLHHL